MRQPIETQLYLPPQADSPIILPFEDPQHVVLVNDKLSELSNHTDINHPLIRQALELMIEKAKNKLRKVRKEPTVLHAIRSAMTTAEFYPQDIELIIKTLLHDIHEDSDVPFSYLEEKFNANIREDVEWVTADTEIMQHYRALIEQGRFDEAYTFRKKQALNKAIRGGHDPIVIKISDLNDNARDMVLDFQASGMESFIYFNANPTTLVERQVDALQTIVAFSRDNKIPFLHLPTYAKTVSKLIEELPPSEFGDTLYVWNDRTQRATNEVSGILLEDENTIFPR